MANKNPKWTQRYTLRRIYLIYAFTFFFLLFFIPFSSVFYEIYIEIHICTDFSLATKKNESSENTILWLKKIQRITILFFSNLNYCCNWFLA